MSRRLSDLTPEMESKAREFIDSLALVDVGVIIYCTHRTFEEQAHLFRAGRSIALIKQKADELASTWGRPDLAQILMDAPPHYGQNILTYAGPGQSNHNYRMAWDGVPLRGGKPVWSDEDPEDRAVWEQYGRAAEELGLSWSGRWVDFRELPHVNGPNANWRKLIQEVTL